MSLYGHISSARISDFILYAWPAVISQNWLFVALDSSRGNNLVNSGQYVSLQLRELGIWSNLSKEGLWIHGMSLQDTVKRSTAIVSFSAAFIFGNNVEVCEPPKYTFTSESENFSDGLPIDLMIDIKRLGALGYVADGQGLNYFFTDSWASCVIEKLSDR